jgi:hypothetical protein
MVFSCLAGAEMAGPLERNTEEARAEGAGWLEGSQQPIYM